MCEAIEQCPDITLLVWCEHVDDEKVYTALGTLLGASATSGGNRGRFMLVDAQADVVVPTTFKVPTVTEPTQVAAYFPALLTSYRREWSDADVLVGKLGEKEIKKLVDLKLLKTTNEEPTLAAVAAAIAALTASKPDAEICKSLKTTYDYCQAVADAIDYCSEPVILRASVAMAGVYARVDRDRGVWKAPANVGLVGVTDLISVPQNGAPTPIRIDDTLNGTLFNSKINAIRTFRGRGPVVWGARTMADQSQTDWRYVPVRRLFNTVERDARSTLRTVVFEPNSAPTWEAVRSALDHYLNALWRRGALQGDTPAQAYFVHVGLGVTMTQPDIDNGRLIVKVGLAAVRPAEFIVLQLTQDVTPM
ncbi:hypothetical protein WT71_16235 [Burkholderia stagnalis]|nr:hypothetical protein WT71_16235 [Burkholderia stagnalis]KWI70997.1 hypothetical protein WT73_14020 [Burkholderia stagnalis]